jgi:hypothetical protein
MKKLFTLALTAFFCSLSAMAQIELGDIKFSIKDGAKLSPNTGKITVSFPNVTGVADPTSTSFVLEGSFGNDDTAFDGVEGTFAAGVVFELSEYGLAPATEYALTITSVKVDGTELAAEGGYKLNFKTRGADRKMSWTFNIDDESMAQIVAEATANAEAQDAEKFIDITKGSDARYYVPARNYEEIVLPDGTALPSTEDLIFKFGAKVFYVGGHTGSWGDAICFNGQNQYMTIPDCQEGDVVIFNANRSTKGSASKQTCIQAMDGAAIAPDGLVSSTELQDSIWLGSSFANFKFEVQNAGDLTFRFSNCILKTITIEKAQEKLPCKYNIVAAYTDSVTNINLKELVGETEGISGSTVKVNYPFWLTDAEGNVYTHGSRGNEFVEVFDLKGDTTFVVKYKKTAFDGCVFLSEGEDLENAVLCASPNAAVRSSMAKAAYFSEDVKLVTLQPGTYKIRAVLFDASSTPGYVLTLTKGASEEDEIYLTTALVNFSEVESDLFEIKEPTDITLKAGGGDTSGVDVIMIYASEDAPEDPDGISEVKDAKKVVARKVAKDGRILIQTAAGIFNAVGVQVK